MQQALSRLESAVTRAEAAAQALARVPRADPKELAELHERHSRLKQSVAQSLRQLDDILADLPQ